MELEPILLRSQKKLKGKVSSRMKSVEETLSTVLPVSSNIGVTRLADITDMDILERYCSLPSSDQKKMIQGSYKDVSKVSKTLHPSNVVEPTLFEYDEEMIMDFLPGYDLINNEQVLVPTPLALFRYSPKSPAVNPFAYHHTNGLASGNVLEEAICHSLCEVIERDATSLAELNASALPYNALRNMTKYLSDNGLQINPIDSKEF